MTTQFQSFEIDSSLELVADQWSVVFLGSEPFRTKTKTDKVTLSVGLLNALNEPEVITAIKDGPTDEFEVVIELDESARQAITGTKHGRSASAAALDRFFKKRYIRLPESPVIQQVVQPGPVIPEEKGQFRAAYIAGQAVAVSGLGLSWGIPNYEIMSDFLASGRVVDTVKRLVRPWQFVAPFQADIFDNGVTLAIKQRNPHAAPDFTISLTDAKRGRVILRVRKTQKYGTVTLRGRLVGDELELNQFPTGLGNVFIQGTQTETQVSETFDANEQVISRVITTSTFAMPSHDLLRQEKLTYGVVSDGGGLQLTGREEIENTLEAIAIDTTGPVQQVKIKAQLVTREGFDDDNVFRTLEQVDTGYAYDEDQFLSGQTSKSRQWNPDANNGAGALEDTELTVKTIRDIGTLLVEQVVEKYLYQEVDTGSFMGLVKKPVLQTRDTQTQGGHRPGGPGRARPVRTQSPGQSPGGSRQITLSQTISSDADAVDIEESDTNLSESELAAIMAQFVAASDIWEYEVILEGVNMPWIRRGMYLQLEDIPSELVDVPMPLPVLLVTEVASTYTEAPPASSMARIRAFGWSAT